MKTILVAMAFFAVAILFMWGALTFAKYKKKKNSGCAHGQTVEGGCCGAHIDDKQNPECCENQNFETESR